MSEIPDTSALPASAPASTLGTAPTAGAALALLAVGFALLGEYLLVAAGAVPSASPLPALAAFGLGAVAFLMLDAVLPRPPAGAAAPEASPAGRAGPAARLRAAVAASPLRAAAYLLSLALALTVAWLLHTGDGDDWYWDLFALWSAAIALYLAATLDLGRLATGGLAAGLRRHRQAIVDGALLFAFAAVLRLVALGGLPDAFGGDEGLNGLASQGVASTWRGSMFQTLNAYGTLYYFVHAVSLAAFGDGVAALRLPGALAGALAVPACYLAARQMFGRRVALAAGLLLAGSHMHVHFSRVAHGQATDTLTAGIVLFAFLRGLDRRDARWMAVAGVWLGLAQYGYVGGRVIDLVVAVAVVLLALLDRHRVRAALGPIAVAAGAAVVTAAPMVRWALDHPAEYFSRATQVGFVPQGALEARLAEVGGSALAVLVSQLWRALVALLARPVTAFYGARLPPLDWLTAALFVLALVYALTRLRDRRFLLLALHVAGGLFILASVDNTLDSAYRAVGILPSVAILAAWALVRLADGALGALAPPAYARDGLVQAGVALAVAWNVGYYVGQYLPSCGYLDAGSATASRLASYLRTEASGAQVLALTDPDLTSYPSVEYLAGRRVRRLDDLPADLPQPGAPGSTDFVYTAPPGTVLTAADLPPADRIVLVASPSRAAELEAIAAARPGGRRVEFERCGAASGMAYHLPTGP
jgi:4-amino-4-deoxy-L-arabinose transferase-like glycosyltransferase